MRAHPIECEVNDPTSTPLNVRESPNGKIVGALHNGTPVHVGGVVARSGKLWALVEPFDIKGAKSGWVFYQFLDCLKGDAR